MGRYLLDTNIVSYLADTASPFHAAAHDRLAGLADGDEVSLSVRSLFELHHWFAHRQAVRAIRQGVRTLEVHPAAGRPAEDMDPEFREWWIPFGGSGYLVLCRLDGRAW